MLPAAVILFHYRASDYSVRAVPTAIPAAMILFHYRASDYSVRAVPTVLPAAMMLLRWSICLINKSGFDGAVSGYDTIYVIAVHHRRRI